MDTLSLLLLWILCGQVRQPGNRSEAEVPAAEVDGDIERADEQSAGEGAPPAAGRGRESGGEPKQEAASDELTPTRSVAVNPAAPESLLRWLAQADTSLDGKRVTLADLLARIYDRPQQAVVIPAYWKLAAAEYEYRIATDESSRLQQLLPPADAAGRHASDSLLEARLAAAEARLREAELAVISQQHALADQMRLPTSEPLPLTGDLPHAGAYRTFFQERYARVAPPRAYLIDRTLPLLNRSIELRAAAAVAAADSADASSEQFHAGQLDLVSVADSVAELTRQRRAFVAAVRDYNLDIADYALSVVPAGLTSAQLVAILIGSPATAQRVKSGDPKQAADERGGVNQAGFTSPLFAPNGQPTMAPPRATPGLPAAGNAAPANERIQRRSPGRQNRAAPNQSGDAPRRIKSEPPGSTSHNNRPLRKYTAAKPVVDAAARGAADEGIDGASDTNRGPSEANEIGADSGIYTALRDLSRIKRAQELSATLHWSNASAETLGMPTTLADALSASTGFDRRTVIQAYWQVCEQAAAWHVTKQEIDLLHALESAALRTRSDPAGPVAMLYLRTAQLAAQAASEECAAGLLNAQFGLAQLMRRPLDGKWPLPVTPPHAGGYRLKLDAQPTPVLQSSTVRQIAAALPLQHEALQAHADAVVAADAARVEAVIGCENGKRPLLDAITSVRYLSGESLAFLDVQMNYNLWFSQYVLTVAPPSISDSALAGVLVVASR
ncbi:MAG TPA: hypothetical protein VHC22_32090 [Pirellulales bacterium]|nr:hypothetical protein [Pirellulales bacterium]